MPLIDYLYTRNIARTVRKDEDGEDQAAHVITSQTLPRRDEASLQCDYYYQLSLLSFVSNCLRQVWGATFIYKNVYMYTTKRQRVETRQ